MKRQSKGIWFTLLLFLTGMFIPAMGPAAPAAQAVKQPVAPSVAKQAVPTTAPQTPSQSPVDSPLIFKFDPSGKPDPFRPFVDAEIALRKQQMAQKELEAKKKAKALPLSPLQRLGIEQFKLVGIAGNDRNRKAIVQDVSGKFYPLLIGTLIGLNSAKVVQIRESSVLLEEPLTGGSGKEKKKHIEMKLRREGDEGKP